MDATTILDHMVALVDREIRRDGIKTVEFLVGHNRISSDYYVLLCWDLQCYPTLHDKTQMWALQKTITTYFGQQVRTSFIERHEFDECKNQFDMLTIGLYQ